MILAVKLVFSIATLFFIIGYAMRWRNNARHQKLMLLGFGFTLAIAVVLLTGVYAFGASYGPANWLLELTGSVSGAKAVLLAHRGLATVTLVILIAQLVSGIRRHPLHHRLFKTVIPLWIVTYVSGLVIFV